MGTPDGRQRCHEGIRWKEVLRCNRVVRREYPMERGVLEVELQWHLMERGALMGIFNGRGHSHGETQSKGVPAIMTPDGRRRSDGAL